ncbi:MAG: addiction module protein [Bryobacteraceae bacterium]
MSQTIQDFRNLSVAERIQLVEDIWDSIAIEGSEAVQLSEAQRQELQRRVQAHDADPSSAVSWEQVRAELIQRNH